jgi:protein-S-isoprenylcysteine O-methyltransferase Ste14
VIPSNVRARGRWTSIYVSLVIAQLASFAATLLLTERDHSDESFYWVIFWVIVIFGLAWVFVGGFTLGIWSVSARRRDSEGFQQRGVYRYVRHPIYTGLMTVALAFVVVGPTLLGGIGYLAVIATSNARAGVEERMLTEKSSEYAEYRKRTKRFIPFVI